MSDRYRPYNPNPSKRRVQDCTIRAICKATGMSWREVHLRTFIQSHYMDDMQHANKAEILRRTGAECPTAAYIVQPPTPVHFPYNNCGCGGNTYGYGYA